MAKKKAKSTKYPNPKLPPTVVVEKGLQYYKRSPYHDLENLEEIAKKLKNEARGLPSVPIKDLPKFVKRLDKLVLNIKTVSSEIKDCSCYTVYAPRKKS